MRGAVVIALLCAGAAVRGAQSPSEAAVAWLRDVAAGEAEAKLEEETALSPETGGEELDSIRKRIGQLRETVRPDDLKAVADRQDGDLAAVLVSQVTNYDANSVQVHAVGLVKREDRWLPAPLPSSFDSTGLSLRPGFLPRVKVLEDWMLRARSTQFVRLKEDAFSLLVDEMKKAAIPATASPGKTAAAFLAALRERDLPAALAITGGLENPRPSDFEEACQMLSHVLRQKRITHPGWRLLAAPEAVRAVVLEQQDGQEGLIGIAGLDPAENFQLRPQARTIHLPFDRTKSGAWRLRLPRELLTPAAHRTAPGREAGSDPVDADLIAALPQKLAAAGLEARDSPQAAAGDLVAALGSPSFASICRHIDLTGDGREALEGMGRAAMLWQRLHRPHDSAAPVLLELREFGREACALVQVFSGRDPLEAAIEPLFLHRGEDTGWLAHPGFSGKETLLHLEKGAEIDGWLQARLKEREKNWSAGALTRIGGIAADSAPGEEEARQIVEQWREAILNGDGARLLALSACFDDETGTNRMLQNCGYELGSRQKGAILAVHRGGRWGAVSLRVPPAPGDDSADAYPLVVVAATPAGPRVLPELDLYDPLTRSREFLNRRVWDRVSARLPEAARTELESIFEKHRTLSAADRERRPVSTE